jgi:A/G-specific adenine glycosylase
VSIPQPHCFVFYNEVVLVDGNVFQVLSRYFDVETDIALASAKEFASGFRIDAKDNPATLIRRLWSSVLCNAYLKSKLCVCVFNDSCAALQKRK